jgi:aryl-alcohol dehydrogenase-like predicted oxidoreductase
LSTISSGTLRRACKVAHVDAVQTEYSVFDRSIEAPGYGTDLLAVCRELGVGLVIATPLGRGLLTNTFSAGKAFGENPDSRDAMMPRFMGENKDRNITIVANFKALADKKGCTVAQLALAWLLKQGDDIFPIPGTKRIKYLEENWASLDVSLSKEEEAEIRGFSEANEVAGGSLPPAFASYLFRDTKEEE